MSVQAGALPTAPASISAQVPQPPANDSNSQSASRLPANPPAAVSATQVPVAVPAPAGKFASSMAQTLQVQATNSPQPGFNIAATSKAQTKDSSGGSQSNDANTKTDHAASSAVVHADAKEFAQSLDPATANSANAPVVSTGPNLGAATAQAAANTPSSSPDAKPNVAGGAPLPPAQPMPAGSTVNPLVVNSARLVDHPGQTEIRVEMQAETLGSVELRAHMTGDQINASIAVEHHDTQVLLTNELPSLHSALSERDVRVDSLSVSQGMAASTGSGAGGDASQRGFPQNYQKPAYSWPEEIPLPSPESPAEWAETGTRSAGLSVLA